MAEIDSFDGVIKELKAIKEVVENDDRTTISAIYWMMSPIRLKGYNDALSLLKKEGCCKDKMFADIYIDDRAIRFTNWTQTLEEFARVQEEKPV